MLDVCLGIKPLNQKSFVSGFFNAKKFCLKKTVFKSALNQIHVSGHIQGRPRQKGNEKETTTIPKIVTTPPPLLSQLDLALSNTFVDPKKINLSCF